MCGLLGVVVFWICFEIDYLNKLLFGIENIIFIRTLLGKLSCLHKHKIKMSCQFLPSTNCNVNFRIHFLCFCF